MAMIAQVWSFTSGNNDIPYIISKDEVKSNGKTKNVWSCNCPAFRHKKSTCKHLQTLREQAKVGVIHLNDKFVLTEFGKQVLGLDPAK